MVEQLTYTSWRSEEVDSIQHRFEESLDVLKWAYSEYGDELIYACSFGAEAIVLLELINKVKQDAKIIFLDTDLHFKETYQLIERVKNQYPKLKIVKVKPKLTLEKQAKIYGDQLWKHNPNLCCNIRKVEPLAEQLDSVSAWISGLRREQSETRRHTNYINKDDKFEKVKICPLIHWTWKDVWTFILENNLPYNQLHDQGYPSIGCEKCTVPASNETNLRSGRWVGLDKTECGLH